MSEMSGSIFKVLPRTKPLIYFTFGGKAAARASKAVEV